MLRTWALCSVVVPIAMTTLCVLLLVGVAALFGAPVGAVAIDFLTDAMEPLARVTVQLWITAFFMMAACYGVSRQLIRRTLKNPIRWRPWPTASWIESFAEHSLCLYLPRPGLRLSVFPKASPMALSSTPRLRPS